VRKNKASNKLPVSKEFLEDRVAGKPDTKVAPAGHPLCMTANRYVEVLWNGKWHVAEYDSWEPLTPDDFRLPAENAKYTLIYNVNPIHQVTGIVCPTWEAVHESRVRPISDEGRVFLKQFGIVLKTTAAK
jgi:hypothetical protein